MRRTGVHVELRRDPRGEQPRGVVEVLVQEAVERPDMDVCGRKAAEVLRARRRGPGRDRVGAVEIAQVAAPGEGAHLARPHQQPVPPARRAGLRVVEHRVDQVLVGERDRTLTRQQGDRGREPTPRAGPADDEARKVDAELAGVPDHEVDRGEAVLERPRVGRLGSEPVLHRHGHASRPRDERVEEGCRPCRRSRARNRRRAARPSPARRARRCPSRRYTRTGTSGAPAGPGMLSSSRRSPGAGCGSYGVLGGAARIASSSSMLGVGAGASPAGIPIERSPSRISGSIRISPGPPRPPALSGSRTHRRLGGAACARSRGTDT